MTRSLRDTLHDAGGTAYDFAIGIAQWLIDTTGFFEGSPETVLGILLLVGVLLWVLR